MNQTVTMYTVLSDRCGADAFEGAEITAWSSAESALEVLEWDLDWLVTRAGSWCGNCTTWDEEGDCLAPVPVEAVDLTGDGDTWWINGHVTDEVATAAWRVAQPDYDYVFPRDSDLCITRGWWKDAHDPTNDEAWVRCGDVDPDKVAFTVVEL